MHTPIRRISALIGAAFFSVSVAHAASIIDEQRDTLDSLRDTTLNSDLSYDIIESLTTEVGARMVGTPASDKAEDWAMAKMRALGFDKVWKEESETTIWTRGATEVSISAPYPHKLVALALGGSVGTNGKPLSGKVVSFANLDELKAAAPDSLKGKIAYIAYRMARHTDGNGYGDAVGARVAGASTAAEKGAVAYIMRSVGTDSHRVAHTGVMRYKEGVKKIPALALSNPDADLLDNMLSRTQPVTLSVNMTASGPTNKVTKVANVIGEITGSEHPEQVVTLGAHLDSWDVGTGAIDDGIGVGITIAAAHAISQLPQRPKRTIRVILFAAEETGLVGAKDYVMKHKDEMANHVIGAEWDFGNGNIYQITPGVGEKALSAVKDFATYLAPMGISLSDKNNAKGQSDMSALGEVGQPALNFDPDGSDYFDFHHTEDDTLDKVDATALKHNTAIYTMFAYFAANSEIDFRK